jgi:hypothetical protein
MMGKDRGRGDTPCGEEQTPAASTWGEPQPPKSITVIKTEGYLELEAKILNMRRAGDRLAELVETIKDYGTLAVTDQDFIEVNELLDGWRQARA